MATTPQAAATARQTRAQAWGSRAWAEENRLEKKARSLAPNGKDDNIWEKPTSQEAGEALMAWASWQTADTLEKDTKLGPLVKERLAAMLGSLHDQFADVERYIQSGGDPNLTVPYGSQQLSLVAMALSRNLSNGHVRRLLGLGADPTWSDANGKSLLGYALASGNWEILGDLQAYGVSSASDNNRTSQVFQLVTAAAHRNPEEMVSIRRSLVRYAQLGFGNPWTAQRWNEESQSFETLEQALERALQGQPEAWKALTQQLALAKQETDKYFQPGNMDAVEAQAHAEWLQQRKSLVAADFTPTNVNVAKAVRPDGWLERWTWSEKGAQHWATAAAFNYAQGKPIETDRFAADIDWDTILDDDTLAHGTTHKGTFGDQQGNTLLHLVLQKNDNATLEHLISAKPNLNAFDRNGLHPTILAAMNGNLKGLRLLLDNGASKLAKDPDSGEPLLTMLTNTLRKQHTPESEISVILGEFARDYGLENIHHHQAEPAMPPVSDQEKLIFAISNDAEQAHTWRKLLESAEKLSVEDKLKLDELVNSFFKHA